MAAGQADVNDGRGWDREVDDRHGQEGGFRGGCGCIEFGCQAALSESELRFVIAVFPAKLPNAQAAGLPLLQNLQPVGVLRLIDPSSSCHARLLVLKKETWLPA